MNESTISKIWYLGAAAATGAFVAADAEADIIYVIGPWNDGDTPIDIIQGDDSDPILGLRDATFSAKDGVVFPTVGPGSGVLQLWNTGQLIARSGTRTVSGTGFGAFSTSVAFQQPEVKGGALQNSAQVGTDNFVGFQVTDPDVNAGNPVFGWAQLDIPHGGPTIADVQILAFAYDDVGAPIVVGSIPEPSTLGLLALGATGLAALRRRKSSPST